ncbi:carbohydrate ABC transporter permease [Sanguibacter sp. Z1732]|uniref:carbohydrate ABC transporter permease n=1 Tax=Sanguibacter sp. Z1732 TaxID=3435412 RepID=UPI003D9CAD18
MASLTAWNVRTSPRWVGLDNYSELIGSDTFWQVLRNTIVFAGLFVPGVMIISFGLALAVNQRLRGVQFIRGVLFLPYITTMVAVAMLWNWIFATRFGLLNGLLRLFGVEDPPAWLADSPWSLIALVIVATWKTVGFQMILFLAALQGVPQMLYEAARIDGAKKLRQVFSITLPLIAPQSFFIFIITFIAAFQTFEVTYVMTGGGPLNASNTLAYFIYENAFTFGRMGYASAVAMVLAVLVGALTLVSFWVRRRVVSYDL